MFSEAELKKAIDELEKAPTTYQDAEKLATFYTIYDHLYGKPKPVIEPIREVKIDRYNGSEFYGAIAGKRACDVWRVMNEIMEMLKVAEPHIYRAVVHKINNL